MSERAVKVDFSLKCAYTYSKTPLNEAAITRKTTHIMESTQKTTECVSEEYIDKLKDSLFNERDITKFNRLHECYINAMREYKQAHGRDKFTERQEKWYKASRKYFPTKPLDSSHISMILFLREKFDDVKTVKGLFMAISNLEDYLEKLQAQRYNITDVAIENKKFYSDFKHGHIDLWEALSRGDFEEEEEAKPIYSRPDDFVLDDWQKDYSNTVYSAFEDGDVDKMLKAKSLLDKIRFDESRFRTYCNTFEFLLTHFKGNNTSIFNAAAQSALERLRT